MQKKTKIKIITFIISIIWVGLGTLIHISPYPDYNFLGVDCNSLIFNILFWITFPFNFIFVFLIFTDELSKIYVGVLLLQIIKILIYWLILYKIFKPKIKKQIEC
jgi:hypothetical protein